MVRGPLNQKPKLSRLRFLLRLLLGEKANDHCPFRLIKFGHQQQLESIDIGLHDSMHRRPPFIVPAKIISRAQRRKLGVSMALSRGNYHLIRRQCSRDFANVLLPSVRSHWVVYKLGGGLGGWSQRAQLPDCKGIAFRGPPKEAPTTQALVSCGGTFPRLDL